MDSRNQGEEDSKMAPCDAVECDSSSEDDDDEGSTLSTDSWKLNFDELREHMCVDYPNGGFVPTDQYGLELGYWISQQRIQYHRKALGYACLLSDDRIQKLEDLGFWWEEEDPEQGEEGIVEVAPPGTPTASQRPEPKKQMPSRKSKEWILRFEELKSHIKSHHNGSFCEPCSKCSRELRRWVQDQRRKYWTKRDHGPAMSDTISEEHIRELERIRFSWGSSSPNKPKKRPSSTSQEVLNPAPKKQRKDTASSERIRKHGKRMSPSEKWEANYKRLVKYVEKHDSGYILPPKSSGGPSGRRFHEWVCKQRSNYRKSKLSDYRISKLESIGFLWERPKEGTARRYNSPRQIATWEKAWEENYEVLVKYVEKHGSGYVLPPYSSQGSSSRTFYEWVVAQRSCYRKGRLSDYRISKLESIGFLWERPEESTARRNNSPRQISTWEKAWEENYEQLVEYVENHGSGYIIPPNTRAEFCSWVKDQRRRYRKSTLSDYRISKLESIGFLWEKPKESTASRYHSPRQISTHEKVWESNYEQLVKYVEKHGSGYILPPRSSEGSSCRRFYHWVDTQRSCYRNSKLSDYRISKLESIGFLWEKPEESTAGESCGSEDDGESGWLTQDEESRHFSNWGIHGSSVGDVSEEGFAGYSDTESTASKSCTVQKRASQAATSKSQDENRISEGTAIGAGAKIDCDSNIQCHVQPTPMYSRKAHLFMKEKPSTDKKSELAWKRKDAAYKASLCDAKKEVQYLKELIQKKQKRQEDEIHVLRGKIQQLEKQNNKLMKVMVETRAMKRQFEDLRKSHKSEREKRIKAEAKLQAAKKLNMEQRHVFS